MCTFRKRCHHIGTPLAVYPAFTDHGERDDCWGPQVERGELATVRFCCAKSRTSTSVYAVWWTNGSASMMSRSIRRAIA
jgi:hypothetical protein